MITYGNVRYSGSASITRSMGPMKVHYFNGDANLRMNFIGNLVCGVGEMPIEERTASIIANFFPYDAVRTHLAVAEDSATVSLVELNADNAIYVQAPSITTGVRAYAACHFISMFKAPKTPGLKYVQARQRVIVAKGYDMGEVTANDGLKFLEGVKSTFDNRPYLRRGIFLLTNAHTSFFSFFNQYACNFGLKPFTNVCKLYDMRSAVLAYPPYATEYAEFRRIRESYLAEASGLREYQRVLEPNRASLTVRIPHLTAVARYILSDGKETGKGDSDGPSLEELSTAMSIHKKNLDASFDLIYKDDPTFKGAKFTFDATAKKDILDM